MRLYREINNYILINFFYWITNDCLLAKVQQKKDRGCSTKTFSIKSLVFIFYTKSEKCVQILKVQKPNLQSKKLEHLLKRGGGFTSILCNLC